MLLITLSCTGGFEVREADKLSCDQGVINESLLSSLRENVNSIDEKVKELKLDLLSRLSVNADSDDNVFMMFLNTL